MPKPRNYVAMSPLLRKGGPHTKSKTGQRARARLSMEDAIDEWYELVETQHNEEENENGELKAPRSVSELNLLSAL